MEELAGSQRSLPGAEESLSLLCGLYAAIMFIPRSYMAKVKCSNINRGSLSEGCPKVCQTWPIDAVQMLATVWCKSNIVATTFITLSLSSMYLLTYLFTYC